MRNVGVVVVGWWEGGICVYVDDLGVIMEDDSIRWLFFI